MSLLKFLPLHGVQRARREHQDMRDRRKSTARDAKLSKDEVADLAHAAADEVTHHHQTRNCLLLSATIRYWSVYTYSC